MGALQRITSTDYPVFLKVVRDLLSFEWETAALFEFAVGRPLLKIRAENKAEKPGDITWGEEIKSRAKQRIEPLGNFCSHTSFGFSWDKLSTARKWREPFLFVCLNITKSKLYFACGNPNKSFSPEHFHTTEKWPFFRCTEFFGQTLATVLQRDSKWSE